MSRGGVQDRGAWEEGSLLSRLCELCREWVGVGGTLESNILDLSKKMYLTNNTAASVMVISCERVKEREGGERRGREEEKEGGERRGREEERGGKREIFIRTVQQLE